MIKAIIVEDEPKNIRILKDQLQHHCPDLTVIGSAENIKSALSLIEVLKPDLVFLDIEMPYGNAFDLLESIENVNFEIIFITAFSEYAIKAFKYSAIDYLLKPLDIDELIEAVEKATKRIGDKTINSRVKILLENIFNKEKPEVANYPISHAISLNTHLPKITNREREIVTLLSQGKSSKQISDILNISKNTVDNHRQNLLKKFEVTSSAELVIKAAML
jgi:RNA polymerase sigma factor (sigma-70 family)